MPKSFYSTEPSVPKKKIASTSPAPSPRLGSQTSTIIPKKPGRTKALVQPARLKATRHVRGKKHR